VSQLDLHRHFHALGAGVIEEVRIQREDGGEVLLSSFPFFFFNRPILAYRPIAAGSRTGQLSDRYVPGGTGPYRSCSWGSKPTPPGTASTPLPPPASAAAFSGLSATDLIGYDRASLLGKMTASEALMYAQSQQALKQVAAMGMGAAGASQAIYDSGFQNINAAAQQFMLLSGGRAFVGGLMAAVQPFGCGVGGRSLPSFQGLRVAPPATRTSSCSVGTLGLGLKRRSLPAIVVKAATVITPKVGIQKSDILGSGVWVGLLGI
ncbi:hypothetical protein BHE74_00049153, partial [Ensete ventricosum]